MFSFKIYQIFRNTFFEEHVPTDVCINKRLQDKHTLLGKENESYLVNSVSYPNVFSYRWIGMDAQKLSANILE